MATWASVEDYIRTNYKVADQSGSFLQLIFNTSAGRSQMVMVTSAGGLVQFISPFASLQQVSIEQVFAVMRAESILLGITGVDGTLLVTHSQLMETADAEEIDMGLGLVAETADLLEAALAGMDRY